MEPKSNGRNFYQLFAEVLNDKNLNHAEKLLMSILHGLADEDGKCYPSNEWLCEKLDVKERALQDLLSHLENLKYIRRQIVPWAHDPMKKYRLIFTNVKVKFSTSEGAENCTPEVQKTAGIIYKKERIDKKERERASPPPSAPPRSPDFHHVHKKIKIQMKEYDALCDEFGLTKVKEYLDRMDQFADMNPKKFNTYSKDKYHVVIRKWITEDVASSGKQSKNASGSSQLIEKVKTLHSLIKNGDVAVGDDYVEFPRVAGAYFSAHEPNFVEKVLAVLRRIAKLNPNTDMDFLKNCT